jgi:lambda family phage portal protein
MQSSASLLGIPAVAVNAGTISPRHAPTISPDYRASSGLAQELANFWPRNSSGDSSILPAMRLSLDRARDLIRNEPDAATGVMRLVDMLVGSGLVLIATPDAQALGLTDEEADAVGQQIQSEWKRFSRDHRKFCDTRRRLTGNGLFRQLARTFVTAGEATAVLGFKERGGRYATCLATLDPDRLCNPNNQPDTITLRAGVEFDADGAPIAYHIRNAHPADIYSAAQAQTWTRIPRETDWGRPVFIHGFEGDREDQTRAITPFAALVSRLKMISKFADTELASATANALFTAFVKTALPADEIAERMTATKAVRGSAGAWLDHRSEFFEKHPVTLGGVRVPVLPPDTEVQINGSPRQTGAFKDFRAAFLQSIAAHLGISYEQLSMDWTKTNYSSARAALNETWRTIRRLLAVFVDQIVQPIYVAFLEESVDKGYITLPGRFGHNGGPPMVAEMMDAWSQARWIGPGRGYVDPVKEAEGGALRVETVTSTLQDENAEQGRDWEDTVRQQARENRFLTKNELTRQSIIAGVQSASKSNPIPANEDTAKPGE